MAIYLIRATYPNITGMAADEFVNSFVLNAPASLAAAVTAVKAFYDSAPAGGDGTPNNAYLSASVSRIVHGTLQSYDITAHLDGSPHGGPIQTDALALPGAVPTKSFPDQIAAVLSYHADFGTTLEHGGTVTVPSDELAIDEGAPATHSARSRPRSSLRGRIFFGPLDAALGNAFGVLGPGIANNMQAAGAALMTAGVGWCVWSRRTASVHNIVGGWVDNDFGVVRRRRVKNAPKTPWTGHP